MKSVLEEVTLGTDEHVPEKATEVLAELGDVKYLHFEGDIGYSWQVFNNGVAASQAAQPGRHEMGSNQYLVGPDRADEVVDD